LTIFTADAFVSIHFYLPTSKGGLELGGRLARKYYWFLLGFLDDARSACNIDNGTNLY